MKNDDVFTRLLTGDGYNTSSKACSSIHSTSRTHLYYGDLLICGISMLPRRVVFDSQANVTITHSYSVGFNTGSRNLCTKSDEGNPEQP
jgi:hypothetical protein